MRFRYIPLISLIPIVFLPSPLRAQPQAPDTLGITFPVLFTRNDGQWDASIRFAVLHQSSEVSLRGDGIDIVPPETRPRAMPDGEVPRRDTDRIRLRFANPSAEMRVAGTDTAETVMHFYYDGRVDGGTEHVPTFRNVRYENV